ncbi:MAG: peptide deformylase [Algisphaera sp.]
MSVNPTALKVVNYPDPVLLQVADAVPTVDDTVRAVAARMIELMHEHRGVGLAAPQVGLPWRMFVANPEQTLDGDRVYINPQLLNPSSSTSARDEGCLSLPHVTAEITRPVEITIEATGLDGETFSETSDVFPARVWQHEYDHLEGVLLLDRMTRVDRMANKRAIRELES